MEELCDGICTPLFGDSGIVSYKVAGTNCSVISRTRDTTHVKSAAAAADGLYADNLWPGCFVLADILVSNSWLCKERLVLELGAGSALPSLVAAVLDAKLTVITDYPEPSIIENIDDLIVLNRLNNACSCSYKWGDTVDSLLQIIKSPTGTKSEDQTKFNLIICAELLWRDTYPQHDNLLHSISQSLCPRSGVAIVTFVHRPTAEHTPENDLTFFTAGQERYGLRSKQLGVVTKYKDCLDDGDGNADVQVYALYFSADVDSIRINA